MYNYWKSKAKELIFQTYGKTSLPHLKSLPKQPRNFLCPIASCWEGQGSDQWTPN